jgi:hypothetical protein
MRSASRSLGGGSEAPRESLNDLLGWAERSFVEGRVEIGEQRISV